MDIKRAIEIGIELRDMLEHQKKRGERAVTLKGEYEALDTLISFAEEALKHPHPSDVCEVCWTSSWAPCPKDFPGARQIKGKETYVVCQMCRADDKIKELSALQKSLPFNVSSMDARVWAKEFMRIYNNHHQAEVNEWIQEDLMIGWFANAIMAGYDEAKRKSLPMTEEELADILDKIGTQFYSAGAFGESLPKLKSKELAHAIYTKLTGGEEK